MGWVWIVLGIALSVVVIGIVFVFGMAVEGFFITKVMYKVIGREYTFKEFLKEIFGYGETDA